jgi:prepilin-type N-terminal cleavage/methylation domain-containing protein
MNARHTLSMRGRRGFTLVEVLAAVALLVLLAAAVMSFLSVLRDRQKTVGDAYERQRGLSLVMERLDAEVTTCFADDGEGRAGVQGNASGLKLGSRGVGIGSLGASAMQISSTQMSSIELTGDELRVTREEEVGGPPQILRVPGIGKVRFRYHNGREWTSQFDSRSARGLPLAIEVSVWFAESVATDKIAGEAIAGDGFASDGEDAQFDSSETADIPPDRVRVFVVPDGIVTGKSGSGVSEPLPASGGAS